MAKHNHIGVFSNEPLRYVIGIISTYFVAGLTFFALSIAVAQEQLSDPGFDAAVANPAYRLDSGPRVLFDEAHFNFHTAGGRYKAFADLLMRDGYRISPGRERRGRAHRMPIPSA
ncbi:MAG TPA: hypothetical protein VHC97_04310 [Thermoanaerobaculia bacterium]|jgi:hypothetical protein|nr:hypothetical protein [Thermoanaerobaculia bacterium]